MNTEITNMLQEEIYKIYRDNYPSIFSLVKEGVKHGYSPKDIKKEFEKKWPNDRLQIAQIGMLASYLVRCPDGA